MLCERCHLQATLEARTGRPMVRYFGDSDSPAGDEESLIGRTCPRTTESLIDKIVHMRAWRMALRSRTGPFWILLQACTFAERHIRHVLKYSPVFFVSYEVEGK